MLVYDKFSSALLLMHLIYSLVFLPHLISLRCITLPCLTFSCLPPPPPSSLYHTTSFSSSFSRTIRNELQGELLEPEEAFDMLIASHQSNFRPMYGDSDVLTLSSFDGFEITKQVNITIKLYCIMLCRIVLYCIVLYCIVSYCTVQYFTDGVH